jgi:hypothetical protein
MDEIRSKSKAEYNSLRISLDDLVDLCNEILSKSTLSPEDRIKVALFRNEALELSKDFHHEFFNNDEILDLNLQLSIMRYNIRRKTILDDLQPILLYQQFMLDMDVLLDTSNEILEKLGDHPDIYSVAMNKEIKKMINDIKNEYINLKGRFNQKFIDNLNNCDAARHHLQITCTNILTNMEKEEYGDDLTPSEIEEAKNLTNQFAQSLAISMFATKGKSIESAEEKSNKAKERAKKRELDKEEESKKRAQEQKERERAEKRAAKAFDEFMRDEELKEQKKLTTHIKNLIKKNPPAKLSKPEYIKFIKKEVNNQKFGIDPKKISEMIDESLKPYFVTPNKVVTTTGKVADESVTTIQKVTETEKVDDDNDNDFKEVIVSREDATVSIRDDDIDHLEPYVNDVFVKTNPDTSPGYRKGILAITCFTKKDPSQPNEYVEDIGLHGLWPYPLKPTVRNSNNIKFEDEDIKREYQSRNPYINPKKLKSKSKSNTKSKSNKANKFYNYTFDDESRTTCLAQHYDYFEHEWVKHGIYSSIYETVDEHLEEACELAKPIILMLKYIVNKFKGITFQGLITMIRQIPTVQPIFKGGFIFNKNNLPYGQELHFSIVGIPDILDNRRFTWMFGQHDLPTSDSGRRRSKRKTKVTRKSRFKKVKFSPTKNNKKVVKRSRQLKKRSRSSRRLTSLF